MLFKKLASLMAFFLDFLIANVNSSLASIACIALSIVPSPDGRSIVCSSSGILGMLASGFFKAAFLAAFAAFRLCFRVLA